MENEINNTYDNLRVTRDKLNFGALRINKNIIFAEDKEELTAINSKLLCDISTNLVIPETFFEAVDSFSPKIEYIPFTYFKANVKLKWTAKCETHRTEGKNKFEEIIHYAAEEGEIDTLIQWLFTENKSEILKESNLTFASLANSDFKEKSKFSDYLIQDQKENSSLISDILLGGQDATEQINFGVKFLVEFIEVQTGKRAENYLKAKHEELFNLVKNAKLLDKKVAGIFFEPIAINEDNENNISQILVPLYIYNFSFCSRVEHLHSLNKTKFITPNYSKYEKDVSAAKNITITTNILLTLITLWIIVKLFNGTLGFGYFLLFLSLIVLGYWFINASNKAFRSNRENFKSLQRLKIIKNKKISSLDHNILETSMNSIMSKAKSFSVYEKIFDKLNLFK